MLSRSLLGRQFCFVRAWLQRSVSGATDLLEGLLYVFAGLMKEHYTFEPKVEIFAHNRLPWVTRADSVVQTYDHNGTIERVSELLENIDQRG